MPVAGLPAGQFPGLKQLAGVSQPPRVKRAALVGNRISPADIHHKPDGTVVRTLWRELAWQLGGKEGHAMVRMADEKGVSPGDSVPPFPWGGQNGRHTPFARRRSDRQRGGATLSGATAPAARLPPRPEKCIISSKG